MTARDPRKSVRMECATCFSEQDVALDGALFCVICRAALLPDVRAAAPAEGPVARSRTMMVRAYGARIAAAAENGDDHELSSTMAAEELAALREVERSIRALLVLVPFWGAWRMWRSDLHSVPERRRFVTYAAAFSLALFAMIWLVHPIDPDAITGAQGQTDRKIHQLGALIRHYAHEFGSVPAEGELSRRASRGDLRYFDAWRRPFVYRVDPSGFVLGSYGKDGAPGGERENADVFIRFTVAVPAAASVTAATGSAAGEPEAGDKGGEEWPRS
jgi:hypothetical protein